MMMVRRILIALCALFITMPALAADAPPQVAWRTVDGGGGISTGGPFQLHGTAGQADAGTLAGGPFILYSGYWHPLVRVPTTALVLAYAQARREGSDVRIRWGTQAETDTTSFRVERSSPCDSPREVVGTVESQGSQGGDYALLDPAPPLPACYMLIELLSGDSTVERARLIVGDAVYLPFVRR